MSGLLLYMAKGAQLCNMMIAIQKKKEREQDKKKDKQPINQTNTHKQTHKFFYLLHSMQQSFAHEYALALAP